MLAYIKYILYLCSVNERQQHLKLNPLKSKVMATTIRNQVASITAAAAHFALQGYHTNTIISKESGSAQCTIYFQDLRKKEQLTKALQCFADKGDSLKFHELRSSLTGKFYTIDLTKELSL